MPRRRRCATGGYVFHVLNRAAGRRSVFTTRHDYLAFEAVLADALDRVAVRLLSFCLMPNHWHLILWPRRGQDDDLSQFMRWLTVTHTQRWHSFRGTAGTGPLYQGRFKSFPVQGDERFLTACRYVERNALRAGLVSDVEQWRWSSLWHRMQQHSELKLHRWPVERPKNWVELVNTPQTEDELAALRLSLRRGCPFGSEQWSNDTAERLDLSSTRHPRGRPRKQD